MKRHCIGKAKTRILAIISCALLCCMAPSAHAEFQKTKIAVLDFELIGDKIETTSIGAILSEWFVTGVVKSGRFDVVERAMLQKIISEQKLSSTGIIDEKSAATLGKLLGVKVIITGSILKLRDTIEVNSRVINVESGSIIAAENTRSSNVSDLHPLVEDLIAKILRNFPLTGYIVKKDPKTVLIDLGLESGLASGTEFLAFKEGEVIKHPKTGEVLDVVQIVTGRIRITRVTKNVAEGQILSEESGGGIEYGNMVKSVQKEMNGGGAAKPPEKVVEKPVVKERPAPQESPPPPPETKQEPPKPERVKAPPPVVAPPVAAPPPPPPVKEKPAIKEPPAQPESAKPAPEAKPGTAKTGKSKSGPQFTPPPVAAPPVSPPPPEPTQQVVKEPFTGYKAALLPFQMSGDADSYTGIMVERIQYQLKDLPELTLAKSYYRLKGVGSIPDVSSSGLFSGSSPNMDKLRQIGTEQGINVAILGKMTAKFKAGDQGSIQSFSFVIVDLTTGTVYDESGSPPSLDARDAIDLFCNKALKKFGADIKNAPAGGQGEKPKPVAKVAAPPATGAPPPAPKEQAVAKEKFTGYKAALLPFQMSGDADGYTGLLVERIQHQLKDIPGLTLVKSYYKLKGLGAISDVSAGDLLNWSSPNLEKVTQLGTELGINVAILGRMNAKFKAGDQGSIRSIDFFIVDLTTGTTYGEVGSPPSVDARDAIDLFCRKALDKFLMEMKH